MPLLQNADGVLSTSGELALETLARTNRTHLQTCLLAHRDSISAEVERSIEQALLNADSRDAESLARFYGDAITVISAGATARATELAHQTAVGLASVIARQNIDMSARAERLWYEVAGNAITARNMGLKPLKQILAEGVVALAASGIETIDYKSGISSQIDVAIRRHVVSQASQAGGRMTINRLQACGHELVITSAHYGARPSHAEWQGKPCLISGPGTVDGVHYPGLADLTGYGTVTGLKGVNCRHSLGPYYPGITKLPNLDFPTESAHFGQTSEQYYEATQRQRELERRIRKTKREVAALERAGLSFESPTYVQKRLLLGKQQSTLRAHCAESQLVRQYAREKAYGVSAQPRALRTHTYWSSGTRKSYTLSDLSSFEQKYRGTTGHEIGEVFALDGKHLLDLTSNPKTGKIVFCLPEGYQWEQVAVAHTHPDKFGGTFSMADMFFVTDSGVHELHAVCQEGTYSIATGVKSKAKSFMRAYDKAYQDAVRGSAGSPDRTGDVRRTMHTWLSKNASRYGYNYMFKGV